MHGSTGHARLPDAADAKANAPQMKIKTAIDTAMRCARLRPKGTEQAAEYQIEEHVGRLVGHHQAGEFARFHQLRQPRIVDVARKIARLNMRSPITGQQRYDRRQHVCQRIAP